MILMRDKPEADRTQGTLFWGSSFVAFTIEPGDDDLDHPRVSPGFYMCEPHSWEPGATTHFKKTWALVGHGVSHQPEPGIPRSAVLIHAGNRDDDTLGCIVVGLRRGVLKDEPAVLESAAAMERLRDIVGHDSFYLTILGG